MNTNTESNHAQLGRQLEKYARSYAKNRYMPWLVLGAWVALAGAFISGGLTVFCSGYSHGRFGLAGLGITLAVAGLISMLWPGLMRRVWIWGTLFYRADGYVSLHAPQGSQTRRLRQFVIVSVAVICSEAVLLGHDTLVQRGVIPLRWTLPLSALYMVPFLLVCGYGFYRDKGLQFLLATAFYVLYALLALLGLPVGISKQPLLMISSAALIAMVASMLIGECTSRLALNKLRRAARMAPHINER